MKRLIAVLFALALVCTFGGAVSGSATPVEGVTSIAEIVDVELAATLTEAGMCEDVSSDEAKKLHCYTLNSGFDDGWYWEISQCVWDDGSYAASCFVNSCDYNCNLPRTYCVYPE